MARLRSLVATLASTYGEPAAPPSTDPYELALWESVAYLVDDARRAAAYSALRERVGLSPKGLLGAPHGLVASLIASGGMHPERRAEKLMECARLADEIGVATLARLARSDPKKARELLKTFPGIGEPVADRILMINGSLVTLAPESNGLRVLLRYGYGSESKSYGASYRSAVEAVLPELAGAEAAWLVRAHQLLRRHGQELCKRSDPRCEVCPLAVRCRFASGGDRLSEEG